MDRVKKFNSLANHPWLKRKFSKLSARDKKWASLWISERERLTQYEFEIQTNRIGLDQPEFRAKFKDFFSMIELISASNNWSIK